MEDLVTSLKGLPALFNKALAERDELLATNKQLLEESEQNFVIRQAQQARYSNDISLKQTLKDTEAKLAETRKQLRDTQKALDETKNRLSKLMGHNLYDGNSDIADLSDPKRPQKIAEFYSELYDNQWTDAYELLHEGYDEKKTVDKLMQILVDAHKFCEQQVAIQMSEVFNVLTMSKNGDRIAGSREKMLVKELRKLLVDKASTEVYKRYMADLGEYGSEGARNVKKVRKYAEECIKIGWYMAVQDPPVVFASVPRKGDKFDRDMYAAYTQAGSKVDYVVWPALLLSEGGKVLRKGVAQGNGDNARPVSAHSAREERVSDRTRPTSSFGRSGLSEDIYRESYIQPAWDSPYDELRRSEHRRHDFRETNVKPRTNYSQSVRGSYFSGRTYVKY